MGILQSSRLLVLGLKQPWRIADIIRQGPQPRPLPPAEPQPCPQRCLASLDQARSAGSTERQSAFPDNAHISDIINPGPQPRPRPQICLASLDQARSTGSTEGRSAFSTPRALKSPSVLQSPSIFCLELHFAPPPRQPCSKPRRKASIYAMPCVPHQKSFSRATRLFSRSKDSMPHDSIRNE